MATEAAEALLGGGHADAGGDLKASARVRENVGMAVTTGDRGAGRM